MQNTKMIRAIAPAGTLRYCQRYDKVRMGLAYFKRKIHLQVVLLLIAPPTSGPENNEMAKSAVT